jgi:hypothetical protein
LQNAGVAGSFKGCCVPRTWMMRSESGVSAN